MSNWTTAGTAIHDQVGEQLVHVLVHADLSVCMCILIGKVFGFYHYFEKKKGERDKA